MQKITPFLWLDNQAEEAMNYYTAIFPDSKIGNVRRYPEGSPEQAGSVMTADFELMGQKFMVLNGGPQPGFKFNESISFFVSVESQDEVDHLWNKLTEGGAESQCGWLKDKFGLSWQIIPTALGQLMGDPDPVKSQRVMQAMLKMKKIIIADLQAAYDQ